MAEIPQVCEAVGRGTATVAPFELEIRGAGAFPHPGRPKTIWLGTGRGQAQMIALHGAVEAALCKLGFRKEHRRFEPHLTLGRARSGGPAVAALAEALRGQADFRAGVGHVGEVVVFSSELQPTGPLYAALGRAPVGRRVGARGHDSPCGRGAGGEGLKTEHRLRFQFSILPGAKR